MMMTALDLDSVSVSDTYREFGIIVHNALGNCFSVNSFILMVYSGVSFAMKTCKILFCLILSEEFVFLIYL